MLSIEHFELAYETLNKSYLAYEKNKDSEFAEFIEDSCVKRFEYTLETAWKLMKKILIKKYGKTDSELTINNIFRFMQGYGYAQNWENWKKYYQQRNNTAFEYNIEKSRNLVLLIPEFLNDVVFLINRLKKDKDID